MPKLKRPTQRLTSNILNIKRRSLRITCFAGCAAFFLVFMAAGCRNRREPIAIGKGVPKGPPAVGGTIREATLSEPVNLLGPFVSDGASSQVAALVYNGLVKYDGNLKLTGDLARNWSVSSDGRIITFNLRKGVLWHDNRPFTADDVYYTWRFFTRSLSPYRESYSRVKKMKIISPYRIRVYYEKPFAPALESWSTSIIPAHVLRGELEEIGRQRVKSLGKDLAAAGLSGKLLERTIARTGKRLDRAPADNVLDVLENGRLGNLARISCMMISSPQPGDVTELYSCALTAAGMASGKVLKAVLPDADKPFARYWTGFFRSIPASRFDVYIRKISEDPGFSIYRKAPAFTDRVRELIREMPAGPVTRSGLAMALLKKCRLRISSLVDERLAPDFIAARAKMSKFLVPGMHACMDAAGELARHAPKLKVDKLDEMLLHMWAAYSLSSGDPPAEVEPGLLEGLPSARKPIGTGPYRLVRWDTNQQVILKRFDRYFESRSKRPLPGIDKVVFRVIPEQVGQFLELKSGGIDSMGLTPVQYDRQTSGKNWDRDFAKYRYTSFSYTYLGFNLEDERFSDPGVRKAIACAIDCDEIINIVLLGYGKRISGPFHPDTWAYDHRLKPPAYDPEKAKRLLAQAGYRPGRGGILVRDGKPFEFTIITNQNDLRRKIGEIIQWRLRDVGIRVQLRVLDWSLFIHEYIDKRKFEACILGWSLGRDPDQYEIWHSDNIRDKGFNFLSFRDRDTDRLIEKGRTTFDLKVRTDVYRRMHRRIWQLQPCVFLYVPQALPIVHRRIRGIVKAPAGIGYGFVKWWIPPMYRIGAK